jgi:hypothetical protein
MEQEKRASQLQDDYLLTLRSARWFTRCNVVINKPGSVEACVTSIT